MTTYEKIKTLLELNTLRGVAWKDKKGQWKVFTYCNTEGMLGGTFPADSIEGCFSNMSSSITYDERGIEKYFTSDIVPIPMKQKIIPVGTKVEILDIMKEAGDFDSWHPIKKCSTDGTVAVVYDDYNGVYYDVLCSNGLTFTYPSYCIVPYFNYNEKEVCSKEDTRERIVLNGKTYVLEE